MRVYIGICLFIKQTCFIALILRMIIPRHLQNKELISFKKALLPTNKYKKKTNAIFFAVWTQGYMEIFQVYKWLLKAVEISSLRNNNIILLYTLWRPMHSIYCTKLYNSLNSTNMAIIFIAILINEPWSKIINGRTKNK